MNKNKITADDLSHIDILHLKHLLPIKIRDRYTYQDNTIALKCNVIGIKNKTIDLLFITSDTSWKVTYNLAADIMHFKRMAKIKWRTRLRFLDE